MTVSIPVNQGNMLKQLTWGPCKNDNKNDIEFTQSPTHDYTIEEKDTIGRYTVRYYNRLTSESGKRRDFTSIYDAKHWVQNTHAEEKFVDWLNPNSSPLDRCAQWFKIASPNPTLTNVCVQQGVHYEEVSEMLKASGDDYLPMEELGKMYKSGAGNRKMLASVATMLLDEARLDELIDSAVDQIVTAVGLLTFLGVDVSEVLDHVNQSNFSKFVDNKPVRDSVGGKILKGPDYVKPNLKPFIEKIRERLFLMVKQARDSFSNVEEQETVDTGITYIYKSEDSFIDFINEHFPDINDNSGGWVTEGKNIFTKNYPNKYHITLSPSTDGGKMMVLIYTPLVFVERQNEHPEINKILDMLAAREIELTTCIEW